MNKYLFVSFAALVACGVEDEMAVDGEHDRYVVDGKTDTGGIAEGTDDAFGVLAVVNSLTDAQLRNDVNLAVGAVTNIVAYRNGDDETAGTSDDQQFETLAELDSIPFVGPVAFGKLLAFADAEGYTDDPPVLGATDDPFDPNACQGAPMSQTAANARWLANQSILGSYQIAIRRRTCSSGTCGAWSPVSLSTIPWATKADGQLKLAKYGDSIKLQTVHGVCSRAYGYGGGKFLDGALCNGVGHTLYCSTYAYPRTCDAGLGIEPYKLPNGHSIEMEGKLTENCVQLRAERATEEAAILVRF